MSELKATALLVSAPLIYAVVLTIIQRKRGQNHAHKIKHAVTRRRQGSRRR